MRIFREEGDRVRVQMAGGESGLEEALLEFVPSSTRWMMFFEGTRLPTITTPHPSAMVCRACNGRQSNGILHPSSPELGWRGVQVFVCPTCDRICMWVPGVGMYQATTTPEMIGLIMDEVETEGMGVEWTQGGLRPPPPPPPKRNLKTKSTATRILLSLSKGRGEEKVEKFVKGILPNG